MSSYDPEDETDVTGAGHAPDPVAGLDDAGIGTMWSAEPATADGDANDGDLDEGR